MSPKILLIVVLSLLLSNVAIANPYPIEVMRVIDGDTVEIAADYLPPELKQKLSIRVVGIDTPEKAPRAKCEKEAALAKQASAHTTNLIKKAKYIEMDIQGWDKYGGRILGSIRVDGVDLAQSLIKHGFARKYFGEKKQSWCD